MGKKAVFACSNRYKSVQIATKAIIFVLLLPMMKTTEETLTYIELLKQQIEEKVAWGSSTQWAHQDFNELSERIWEDTQTKLSVTTLKRLWGKVDYQSQPTANTLNALARFAGYDHWRDFIGQHETTFHTVPAVSSETPLASSWWTARKLALVISVPLLLVGLLSFNRWINRPDAVDSSLVSFTSEPVTQGLPNTVVFHYDASSLLSEDIAIQQSWDRRLRASVAKEKDTYTTTYYYPGYFKAKLLANNQVVKEHDLYIQSDGWMTIAEAEPTQGGSVPYYLSNDSSTRGQWQVSPTLLRQQDLLTRDAVPWINYYYVQDLGELSGNHFTLETRIKNDFAQGEAVCQTSLVNVICSQGHFSIPLAIPGCVGELTLALGKERISGKTHDLSSLGTNLSVWQTLRCEVRDRQVSLFLNDKLVYQGSYSDDVGKIAGLRYRFHGPGAIDYVRLWDAQGEIVYEEEFDKAL